MNEIQAYTQVHKSKRISKRIQQLSFSLNKIEQRFDVEELQGDDLIKLAEAYAQIFKEIEEINNEIKNEQLAAKQN